jgi:hypothetical protein
MGVVSRKWIELGFIRKSGAEEIFPTLAQILNLIKI